MLTTINQILGLGAILLQVFVVVTLSYYLLRRHQTDKIIRLLQNQGLWLAWAIALVSVLGSLYYSEIARFAPCELCWFQRIAIYPQVLLLGISAWRQDALAKFYSLPLLATGLLISLYHNYLYYNPPVVTMCGVTTPSCTSQVVMVYGYVSIPLMAATAIIAMILLVLVARAK